MQNLCSQSVVVIVVLYNNRRSSGVKNLMVFNAIESPDIVLSSKQPKCVTLEYCFSSVSLYIILSFTAFFNFASNLKISILSCLHQDKYVIYCLRTIDINQRSPYLIDVQLYEHLYVGMLSLNRLRIKTNRNER